MNKLNGGSELTEWDVSMNIFVLFPTEHFMEFELLI